MTHPPGGGHGGGSGGSGGNGTGPGRAYATPLTEEQRLWHYTHQNGRVDHYRPGLTPRQRRRLEKKARRDMARGWLAR